MWRVSVYLVCPTSQVSSRAEALVLSSQLLHRGFLVPCDDSVSASSFNDDGTLYVLGMGTPGLIHPSPEPSVYKGEHDFPLACPLALMPVRACACAR